MFPALVSGVWVILIPDLAQNKHGQSRTMSGTMLPGPELDRFYGIGVKSVDAPRMTS